MEKESKFYGEHEQVRTSYEKRNEQILQNALFFLRAIAIRITFWQIRQKIDRQVFQAVNSPKILDVGCRKGDKAAAIVDLFENIFGEKPLLIGGDLCLPKDHYYKGNLFSLEMLAEEMPFSDNSFEAVTALAVHHHFPDLEMAFKEMKRVLKPGGCLLLVDTHPLENSIVKDFLTKVVTVFYEKFESSDAFFNEVTVPQVRDALDKVGFERVSDFWSPPFLRVFVASKK